MKCVSDFSAESRVHRKKFFKNIAKMFVYCALTGLKMRSTLWQRLEMEIVSDGGQEVDKLTCPFHWGGGVHRLNVDFNNFQGVLDHFLP